MILAPMQGLTEVLFRRTYEECFPGVIPLAVAPFISLTHNLLSTTHSALPSAFDDVLPENNRESMTVVPQILGKEPEEFVAVATRLRDMGYDEVNWNIGCPMRAITAKHRGSGILPHPDELRAVLDEVMPRLPLRLSVKMRLGLQHADECFGVAAVLADYPLASITVHPRLGRQQYSGVPDLDTFERLLPLLKVPVIYNGDLRSQADIDGVLRRFPGLRDIMVGRGILYNPTLPLGISDARQSALFIRRLIEAIHETFPHEQGRVRKIKEYWCLLWKSQPISEMDARKALREQDLETVEKIIFELLQ